MSSSRLRTWGRTALICGAVGAVGVAAASVALQPPSSVRNVAVPGATIKKPPKMKPREQHLQRLRATDRERPLDCLVIGGGATGAGIALDAATRNLTVGLVERGDFSCGTSSRSTKLLHGGVRYLEKAFLNFDIEQFKLVYEALTERANLLEIAPHLSKAQPIMLPLYSWWKVPYYWVGIKVYDFIAGRRAVERSYVLGKGKALDAFPMLKADNLKGAIVYYDGIHNDARMNLEIALTAAREGAAVANYVEVVSLVKDDSGPVKGRVIGARVRDLMTGSEWDIHAKCVINATGPFTDAIREMDDSATEKIVKPSAGIHVTLPGYYSPCNMGLLDPSTSDGRVIFFLPWLNSTIAGTTDTPTEVTGTPQASQQDVDFVLAEIERYLSKDVRVRRGDVKSTWSGIRPLVRDPKSKNTEELSRNHVIDTSPGGLVTVAGGKWTTYRSMAADAVDEAVREFDLPANGPSRTLGLRLLGSDGFSTTLFIRLVQEFGLEEDVARHLSETYGSRAVEVASRAHVTGHRWPLVGTRLVEGYPYIEAEIDYAVEEYALCVTDVLARRTRLAFLNVEAANFAIPRIVEIMGKKLGWSKARCAEEHAKGTSFLKGEMGLREGGNEGLLSATSQVALEVWLEKLAKMDLVNSRGDVRTKDLRKLMTSQEMDPKAQARVLAYLRESGLETKGKVAATRVAQLLVHADSGELTDSPLAAIMAQYREDQDHGQNRDASLLTGGL